MDAPGKRPELHDMARVLARAGYPVMLPDLYYRTTPSFDANDDLDGRVDEIRALIATLDFDTIALDAKASMRHAATDPRADISRVGVVGSCMSGAFAVSHSVLYPERERSCSAVRTHPAVAAPKAPSRPIVKPCTRRSVMTAGSAWSFTIAEARCVTASKPGVTRLIVDLKRLCAVASLQRAIMSS